ncbi:unnamed protein product [Cyprideis torosa]|uniref:Uncharacterized protein n=1 Tax=Cyprideis torosa TaxID=163714 RepID=A0A7R8W931_9CRUS|nr:unnamed protein product [Cyprideis torosa]CAG0888118.1 unnamed protein product [Cyprideis torosa]
MTTPSQRSDGFPTFPPVSAVTTTPFPVSARMTTPPPVSPGFPTPPPVSPGFPTPPSVSAGAPTPLLVSSADDPPNYVGELLDLCQHRRWSRPEYSVAREEDNERGAKTFFVQCTVQGKQGVGEEE